MANAAKDSLSTTSGASLPILHGWVSVPNPTSSDPSATEWNPPCPCHVGQGERRRNRCHTTTLPGPEPAREGTKEEECPDNRDTGQVDLPDGRLDRAHIGVQQADLAFSDGSPCPGG